MSLRNEHIGVVLGTVVFVMGQVVTGWDPAPGTGALLGLATLLVAVVTSFCLNERDARRSSRR